MRKLAEKMKPRISSCVDGAVKLFRQNATRAAESELLGVFKDNMTGFLGGIKTKLSEAREQMAFFMLLNSAKPLPKEKLSFEEAIARTQALMKEAGKAGGGEYREFVEAVAKITIILDAIWKKLSDPDFGDLWEAFKILEGASLANLEVARRLGDKNFYVGLLGEFSCGKSTFINAMLEEEFLHGDVLQGTTCAKTVLRYGDREIIRVIFDNGKYVDFEPPAGETLLDSEKKREFVRAMTADEKRAASISEVICVSPNPTLTDGLCIVDTPGIGATNPRHYEVATSAMRECDAVLVLTTLDKPLSNELIEGVKKLVGSDAPNCVFIGTRKDQQQQKELPRQRRYFQKKLKNIFGRDCLFEFVSAYQALEELAGRPAPEGSLADFRDFRKQVRSFLVENRAKMQAIKTRDIISGIIASLSEDFERRREEFAEKIERFHEQLVPVDSVKWNSWQKEPVKRFGLKEKEIRAEYRLKVSQLVDEIRGAVKNRIMECDSTNKLKDYLGGGIKATMAAFEKRIAESASRLIYEPLKMEFENIAQDYRKQFKREYEKIENIFGLPVQRNLPVLTKSGAGNIPGMGGASCASLASDMESEENFKIGGGLATGIGISLLVPGVGWIVGGMLTMLGGILGAGLLKSLKARQEEALEKVGENLDIFERRLCESLDQTWQTLAPGFRGELKAMLNAQKEEYGRIIRHHNKSLANLSRKMEDASHFIAEKTRQLEGIAATLNVGSTGSYFISGGENEC